MGELTFFRLLITCSKETKTWGLSRLFVFFVWGGDGGSAGVCVGGWGVGGEGREKKLRERNLFTPDVVFPLIFLNFHSFIFFLLFKKKSPREISRAQSKDASRSAPPRPRNACPESMGEKRGGKEEEGQRCTESPISSCAQTRRTSDPRKIQRYFPS